MRWPVLLSIALAAVQTPAANTTDLIQEQFFPPELLAAAAQDIGLSTALQQKLHQDLSQIQPRFQELQEKLETEAKKLATISEPARIDEGALLAQLEKVQAAEWQLRRLHLKTLATIKNQLSPEQQEQLRRWRRSQGEEAYRARLKQRLEGKLDEVRKRVATWQGRGRDPSAIRDLMQEFHELMKVGKVKEAEAMVDRALKQLNEPE